MVAANNAGQFDLVVTSLSPRADHQRSSTSSLSSTHSRNSFRKTATIRRRHRVRFAPPAGDEDYSHSCGTSEGTSSCSTNNDPLLENGNVLVDTLHYDPEITPDNAPQVFYSAAEILSIRREVRKVAQKFATDYPDVVDTLDQLYQTDTDIEENNVDLRSIHATLRRRRKRLQTMELAKKWDCLFNAFEDDDDNENVEDEDDSTAASASSPSIEQCFCDDDAPEDHLHYGVTRGLEARIVASVGRGDRRRDSIQSVLALQDELRSQGNACYTATQIERCLCARAVQLTRKARMFAVQQALLDVMDLEEPEQRQEAETTKDEEPSTLGAAPTA